MSHIKFQKKLINFSAAAKINTDLSFVNQRNFDRICEICSVKSKISKLFDNGIMYKGVNEWTYQAYWLTESNDYMLLSISNKVFLGHKI